MPFSNSLPNGLPHQVKLSGSTNVRNHVRCTSERSELWGKISPDYDSSRFSVIVADGTPGYLETVRVLMDFHDIVDVLGRASNFEETIQLAVTLRPDLVLMDVEMPSAMVAIAAIVTTVADVHMVGLFAGCIPLEAAGLVLAVNAFVDKTRLRTELLPLLQGMYSNRRASVHKFAPPRISVYR